jgi:hypothetical protein
MTSWPLSSDPNAIYWIIGSAHFSGQMTLNGCVIVTGSLQMTGQATINGNLIVGGAVSGTSNMDINYAAASIPATSSDNVVITAWD